MPKIQCPICRNSGSLPYARRDGYAYRDCVKCAHVFLNPLPTTFDIKKLYSDNYEFRVNTEALNRFRKVSKRIIARLKMMNPRGRSLLDVGTGYGTFVEEALNNNLDAVGIEPAKNLYNIAKLRLESNVINASLEKFLKTNKSTFDYISLIHVIEHVTDPKKTLTSIYELLKPNGILYIETPNIDSHLAHVERENYTFLTPPDHINLFSKKSLQNLLNNLGKPLKSSYTTYSHPEHLVGILRILKQARSDYHLSKHGNCKSVRNTSAEDIRTLPFFDRVVAPLFTPLLNVGNKGSILQVFIKKPN